MNMNLVAFVTKCPLDTMSKNCIELNGIALNRLEPFNHAIDSLISCEIIIIKNHICIYIYMYI